jgi:predicted nucleic acid-binding protein
MLNENVYMARFALSAIEALTSGSNSDFIREILLLIHQGKIKVFETKIDDDIMVNSIKNDLSLDFDDTVQFLAANQLGTYLVTYDKDFSHTSLQTKTPEEVLEELAANS